MNRRLKLIFAAAAIAVAASTPAVLTTGAQTPQEQEQEQQPPAGQKARKPILTSCPVHPEIKARSAGKCPKCRMDERKRKSAQEKKNRKAREAQAQEGTPADEQ